MRAILFNFPDEYLVDRRRKGVDVFDEVWEGVLHLAFMAPPGLHQELGGELVGALHPIAEAKGLEFTYANALLRPGGGLDDYRIPDLVFALPQHCREEGYEGAELIIEILCANDETYEKLPFYASLGVKEGLVIEPVSRQVELFLLRGGKLLPVSPDDGGGVRSAVLGARFARLESPEGPRLEVKLPEKTVAF